MGQVLIQRQVSPGIYQSMLVDAASLALWTSAGWSTSITTPVQPPPSFVSQNDLAAAIAAYRPAVTLGDLMPRRLSRNVPTTDLTSVSIVTTTPTFNNISYAITAANLPDYAQLMGGAWELMYGSYWRNSNLASDDYPPGGLGYWFDGQHCAVQLTSIGSGDLKVYVDGKPWKRLSRAHTVAYGSSFWIDIVLPDRRKRMIEIEAGTAAFVTILTEKTDTVFPKERSRLKVGWAGDSWVRGANKNDSEGVLSSIQLVIPENVRLATDWDVCVAGIGGTGYLNPGASNNPYGSAVRLAGLARMKPDMLIVSGSVNDNGYAEADITAAAAAYYTAVAGVLPGVPIVVIGAEPIGNGVDAYAKCNRAVKAAALAASNVVGFIDMWTKPWLTGTGKVGATTGDGNADLYLSQDGIHPTQDGDEAFGYRDVVELAKLVIRKAS